MTLRIRASTRVLILMNTATPRKESYMAQTELMAQPVNTVIVIKHVVIIRTKKISLKYLY